MAGEKVLRKNKDMVHRVIGGETILLPVYKSSDEINCIYTLNTAAAWVWDRIDGKKTLTQIKKQVLADFDANSDEADKKIDKLVGELKEIKAVV
ncbi:MAG: PqqD family protein [Candidatus Omnitrophota bacterium]